MNESETRMILAQASALDNRKVNDAMIIIWHTAFQGYAYDEVAWALRQHIQTSTEYLVPAHLIRSINEKRHEYRRSNPSGSLTGDAWLEQEREEIAAAEQCRRLRAEGHRYAVDAIDNDEPPRQLEA